MPFIEIRDGSNKGLVHEITEKQLTVGRDEGESIQVYDQGVSRRHAEIFRVGEMYFIRDLGSRNGTFVNEEKVDRELLRVNDRIRIGNTEMVFREGKPSPRKSDPIFTPEKQSKEISTTIEYRLERADPADLDEPEEVKAAGDSMRMQALVATARALADERNPKALLQKLVEQAAQVTAADHAYVFTRSPERKEFTIAARSEREGKRSPTVSTTVIRKVIRESRAVLITDAAHDPEYSEKQSIISKGIRSVVCAPLLSMKELQGVLFLHRSGPKVFAQRDLDLVTWIALQAGMAYQSMTYFRNQENVLMQAVGTLLTAAQMSDPGAAERSRQVARVASAIASVLKVPDDENRRIQLSALLHTIGQVGAVPDAEPSPEFQEAVRAEDLLRQSQALAHLIPGIKHQYERMDGTGTPNGLKGDQIPLSARILAVAKQFQETVEADENQNAKQALVRMKEAVNDGLDPKVIEALMIAFRKGALDSPQDLPGSL